MISIHSFLVVKNSGSSQSKVSSEKMNIDCVTGVQNLKENISIKTFVYDKIELRYVKTENVTTH